MPNYELVKYGVAEQKSDYLLHVCFVEKNIYIFSREDALTVMNSGRYPEVPVKTGSIITATGFPVPPRDIPSCQKIEIPDDLLRKFFIEEKDDTSIKGEKAELIADGMKNRELISIPLKAEPIKDRAKQINGIDMAAEIRIQVKCDYHGGSEVRWDWKGKEREVTGNLFLQRTECNPYKHH